MTGLYREVPRLTPTLSPEVVIDAGATNIGSLAPSSATVLAAIREAYVIAISNTFTYALGMACVAVPCACGMQWLNVKRIAERRKAAGENGRDLPVVLGPADTEMGKEKEKEGDAGTVGEGKEARCTALEIR